MHDKKGSQGTHVQKPVFVKNQIQNTHERSDYVTMKTRLGNNITGTNTWRYA